MDSKKDIYNLWVQYTTKNEEIFFRQFIQGFVSIWNDQLSLDYENVPHWARIPPDSGPHLSRLPDELLPAIEKFLIIARDKFEKDFSGEEEKENDTVLEIQLLVQCLTIICRHFDNITTIIKSSYISNCVALINSIIDKLNHQPSLSSEHLRFIQYCNYFLQALYDPYLTWKNFLRGDVANYAKLGYRISPLHPEIVPFIYDCFQAKGICKHPDVGKELFHILGAVIAGSQVALVRVPKQNINSYHLNNSTGDGAKIVHNGLRAISPATVNIVMDIISKWESDNGLRQLVLQCFTLMAIILQKSSPEQRQIDLLTIFQLFMGAVQTLLETDHFLQKATLAENFELSQRDDNYVDVNSLTAIVDTIEHFLPDYVNKQVLCNAMFEAKFLTILVQIPDRVKTWNIDHQPLGSSLVRSIHKLCSSSEKIHYNFIHTNNINVLFDGLKLFGRPSQNLICDCLYFAFDGGSNRNLNAQIVSKLIEWIPTMAEAEQNYISDVLLKKCTANLQSKHSISEQRIIKRIVESCLEDHSKLSAKCTINLLKLIEELAKHSIHPIELKSLLKLLRLEVNFEYRKHLIEVMLKVSQHRLSLGVTPKEYLDIQNNTNGITIPEIRKWDTAHGFVFHAWIRLDKDFEHFENEEEEINLQNYRRHLFSLTTNYGTGYEFFIQKNGNFVVSVITKKEFFTATAQSTHLLDGRWHSITVSVVPPKRLFSYHQINVYIDSVQKLGSTMKFPAFAEVFHYCAIGAPYNNVRKASHTSHQSNTARMNTTPETSSPPTEREEKPKGGLFPNLMEKTFLPGIVSQVPSYFTLPARQTSTTSLDPSVKSYPIGMQDLVFGEAICLKGQLGCVLLAETNINLKSVFEAGPSIANVLATDMIESFDMASKFVFCFSPRACFDGLCLDLAPGNQYNGHVVASSSGIVSIQNAINGVGGMTALLPILDNISQIPSSDVHTSDELIPLTPLASPTREEHFDDWEMLQTHSLTESKVIQNPIACFICLVRNFMYGNELNKESILKNDGIPIISQLLQQCSESLFDVNVLMAVQLLIESVQNEMPSAHMDLLHVLYKDLVFNFRIWARAQFQIVIGHIQYISTIIKEDRKYFRKHFGTQFLLDTIQEFFAGTCTLPAQDAKMVRDSLLRILRYYIQKEVNIKEISAILTFMTTIKVEPVVVEIIEMLTTLIESKHVKDQIFLLMYEPHMAEALYTLFMDRHFGNEVHTRLLKFIGGMLNTKRISSKHKAALRLYDGTIECNTLYPGLFSFMIPFDLEPEVILGLLDLNLCLDTEMGYAGALCLIYHANLANLSLKLEIAKRLMTSTFTKPKAPQMIAKQVGWQESIARLLIKKPVENRSLSEKEKEKGNILTNIEEIVKHESESSIGGGPSDLIVFDDETMELKAQETPKSANSFMTEAASVIESEFKELADRAQEAVVDNITSSITSVYSVLRQKTSGMQDAFESLTLSFEEVSGRKKNSLSISSSSEENISMEESLAVSSVKDDSQSTRSADDLDSAASAAGAGGPNLKSVIDDNDEEYLVYLVSNILFTILWRGVENTNDSWKERGQVMACINLIALNNELYCSHLTLRLRILEMGVQAALIDLGDNAQLVVTHQQNAAQLLRLAYDLVVLDPNEDQLKKCSTKLLDGVLSLLDILMVFQQSSSDDWSEMSHLCLGLLLKCSHNHNSDIVAMATAKLHGLLQNRINQDPAEIAFLLYSMNQAISSAIEVGNSEQYSFLIPVLKALLDKSRTSLGLATSTPDLPATSSGPIFFQDFQVYCTSKQWTSFIEKKIKPLYTSYQKDLSNSLWEPLNTFWAECYESCKFSSQRRAKLQMESRRKFQEKILIPCRIRQSEELARVNVQQTQRKAREAHVGRRWHTLKRFLYGSKGAWAKLTTEEEFWRLSHNENSVRMRLKLEPDLQHDPHTAASNMRDNTTSSTAHSRRLSSELGSTIAAPAVLGGESIDEDILLLEEELRNSAEPQVPETSGKEKIVISQECELITLMTRVKGRLDLTTNQIIFTEMGAIRDDGQRHDFKFPLSQLRELHLRKFNLRRSALEMFLVDQTSYFLNFTTKTRNKIFTKILSLQPPNILYGSGRSPAELLRSSGLTQKWVNREISNFEYLMHLNTIAGRSYNDLSQYPVFPWILADYTSDILDLNNPKSFRDLSKPIGVVNPKNEAEVRSKFESFEDPSGLIPKFHYGTHYSNSAGVLHYLIRVEPFTSLHIELQSGRFDVADRQFHSIPQTWKLLMDNPNDVKELIPEFFYFPEFLKNMNNFDLGILQTTKERVDDVVLPPWAKSAEDFIAIHRRALESEYVSQNLHHWIDLIFGYKQKGPKAVEALNVFYYCSYEGAVDLDKITNSVEREAVEGMINNFGQTPSQLLKEPHPKRLTQDDLTMKLLKLELKKPDLTLILDRVNCINCELATDKDPVIYLSTPRSPPRSFLQSSPDMLISVTKSGILGCHSWMSFDKEKGFLLEIDATTSNLKNRKRLVGPFHPSVNLNSNLFAVSIDGKYLYAGGIWDNSVRIFNMARGKVVASAIHHFDVVTCLALDSCGSYLVTGSKDCTCIIWSISNGTSTGTTIVSNLQPNTAALNQNLAGNVVGSANVVHLTNNLTPKPVHTLYGHDNSVSCVSIMTELDVVVSGSLDGTVNMYTIKEGQFVRTINPIGCTGVNIEISFITQSYQGHVAFSAFDDTSHSVHVFSINGVSLGSKYVSGRVTGLTTSTDHLVVSDDAGDLTMSRLYGLKPIFDIPLHIPTQTIVATGGGTHLLAPLRDGSLAVIGIMQPIAYKKHAVMMV